MNAYFGLKLMNLAHEKAELVLWAVYWLGLITKANTSSCEAEHSHPALRVSFLVSLYFFKLL